MNFVSAIRQLRNSKCAKTPAMRGYVKREDYENNTANAALFTTNVVAVYDITFVENGDYTDTDSTSEYTFRATVTSDGTATATTWTAPATPLSVDAWLWEVMLRDDWEVFDLGQVQASSESTKRW